MNKNKSINLILRWLLLAAGMFAAASGISIITLSGLGTTPISTVPLAFSTLTGATFGTMTFVVSVVFVLLQWPLLGKYFHYSAFLQIPVTVFFSAFIDIAMALFAPMIPEAYAARVATTLIGNATLALGIVMQLHSRTIVQPGEGLVVALSVRFKRPFGTMKMANDATLACLAAVIGLAFTGAVIGIREGTLVSAFLVGFFTKEILKLWPMEASAKAQGKA